MLKNELVKLTNAELLEKGLKNPRIFLLSLFWFISLSFKILMSVCVGDCLETYMYGHIRISPHTHTNECECACVKEFIFLMRYNHMVVIYEG